MSSACDRERPASHIAATSESRISSHGARSGCERTRLRRSRVRPETASSKYWSTTSSIRASRMREVHRRRTSLRARARSQTTSQETLEAAKRRVVPLPGARVRHVHPNGSRPKGEPVEEAQPHEVPPLDVIASFERVADQAFPLAPARLLACRRVGRRDVGSAGARCGDARGAASTTAPAEPDERRMRSAALLGRAPRRD